VDAVEFELPDPGARNLFYKAVRATALLYLEGFYGLRVSGRRALPRRGGFVLASNHQSFLDPMVLGVASPRPLAFLARESLFQHPLFGLIIRKLNAIPVATDSLSPDALRRAVQVLKRGWPLVVFPEGTRSPDGRLHPLRRGVALLAVRAGVPVIPVRIFGAYAAWPRHRKFPRSRGRIAVAFGPLLVYDSQSDTYDSYVETISRALRRLGEGRFRTYRDR
jgi:1-acyl-sn-glycerol-3-phosphate acyltransferase